MRASEKKDFDAAKDEMTKAIAALESAVSTMADGTNSSTARSLVGIKSKLKKAVRVGSGFLAKRDVQELMKALDVQEPDYEKLNTNNNGKYEHASGEIQDILG
jgi:prefoldin subunit 5